MGSGFEPVRKLNREQIGNALCGQPRELASALLSAAYWDSDWKWAQDLLLEYADRSDPDIQWAVATGLGFLAAFHGQLELEKVERALKNIGTEAAEEALLDIDHFVRRRQAGEDVDLAERLTD